MTTFNIYFNGTAIETLNDSTVRKARNYVNRNYKSAEQCVVVAADVDQSSAIALSKELHVPSAAFEASVADGLTDEALTTAARERSGETICFTNKNAGPTYGIAILNDKYKLVDMLVGVTHDEARKFMRNYKA